VLSIDSDSIYFGRIDNILYNCNIAYTHNHDKMIIYIATEKPEMTSSAAIKPGSHLISYRFVFEY